MAGEIEFYFHFIAMSRAYDLRLAARAKSDTEAQDVLFCFGTWTEFIPAMQITHKLRLGGGKKSPASRQTNMPQVDDSKAK